MKEKDSPTEQNDSWDDWENDHLENAPCESCPQCGFEYDDIDFDFQICNRCKWDNEKEKYV